MQTNKFIEKAIELRNKVKKNVLKTRNVNKHLRIAKATTGHEQEVHLAKAEKLTKRYNPSILDKVSKVIKNI